MPPCKCTLSQGSCHQDSHRKTPFTMQPFSWAAGIHPSLQTNPSWHGEGSRPQLARQTRLRAIMLPSCICINPPGFDKIGHLPESPGNSYDSIFANLHFPCSLPILNSLSAWPPLSPGPMLLRPRWQKRAKPQFYPLLSTAFGNVNLQRLCSPGKTPALGEVVTPQNRHSGNHLPSLVGPPWHLPAFGQRLFCYGASLLHSFMLRSLSTYLSCR